MGSKRREGRQKENGFREKPCITEIFTFYQKGFVIGVKKKKIGSFLILSLIFPTEKFFIQLISNFPTFPLNLNNN